MAYIQSATEYPEETALPGEGSIFTRILATGMPDEQIHVVWRGDLVFAILNRYPYTAGHLLVMPYREVGELEDLTREEATALWAGVRDAVVAVKAAYRPEGVNVGLNLGRAAGAGIPGHLHAHVLPRWNADSNFMTSVAEARVLPEALPDTWSRLRAAWPSS
jgi:ATP adenylyltransferase